MELDHLVVTCADLEEGADWVEAHLGVRPGPGGRHDLMGTHNRLLSLGPDCYLEVIAPDPDAPPPGRARWFGLDAPGAPALTHWAVRVADLDAALAIAPEGAGRAAALSRGELSWRMGVTSAPPLGGAFPMLLRWDGRGAAETLPDAGCRLTSLTARHPHPQRLCAALSVADPRFGIERGPIALLAGVATPRGTRALGDPPR